jgi:hypothetical protein
LHPNAIWRNSFRAQFLGVTIRRACETQTFTGVARTGARLFATLHDTTNAKNPPACNQLPSLQTIAIKLPQMTYACLAPEPLIANNPYRASNQAHPRIGAVDCSGFNGPRACLFPQITHHR